MDSSNNDNYSVDSRNTSHISSISTSYNTSLSNTLINDSPRRSARLSSKSPQIPSRTSNQSNMHRTKSGGITHSHSLKLKHRNRNSFSTGRGDFLSNHSQITHSNDNNIHYENNNTAILSTSLPSDQSEDDEIICNNNIPAQCKSMGIASRSKILSYFDEQKDGYKCKRTGDDLSTKRP